MEECRMNRYWENTGGDWDSDSLDVEENPEV